VVVDSRNRFVQVVNRYNLSVNFESFYACCVEQCRLDPGKGVLAAFSGGADSLSLLISLKQTGFNVTAAHFNHHLRDEADRDEQAAADLADRLGIPFISGGADVPAVVREEKLSVEEAARQCRYTWLLEQAQILGFQAVAIGHTADDQVETILMHLLRGSGLDGLTGMPYRQVFPLWNTSIPVVRPLLDTWREETEAICRNVGLEPVQDASNISPRFFRNRIRLELVPYLREYNPQAKQHLWQTARILAEEQSLLENVKSQAWTDCYINRSEQWLSLRLTTLTELPENLRKSVLRRGLLELKPGLRDIDYEITRRLLVFSTGKTRSGEIHLFNDLWVNQFGDRLTIWIGRPALCDLYPQMEPDSQYIIQQSGSLELAEWDLLVQEGNVGIEDLTIDRNGGDYLAQLNADTVAFPLVIRGQKPGERIAPLGMGGKTQKLSDYFINRKIPRQARRNWPLVISDDQVVWVPGVGISDAAAVTPQTRRVLRLSLRLKSHRPDGQA